MAKDRSLSEGLKAWYNIRGWIQWDHDRDGVGATTADIAKVGQIVEADARREEIETREREACFDCRGIAVDEDHCCTESRLRWAIWCTGRGWCRGVDGRILRYLTKRDARRSRQKRQQCDPNLRFHLERVVVGDTDDQCPGKWQNPPLPTGNGEILRCALDAGHDGPHRFYTKVEA